MATGRRLVRRAGLVLLGLLLVFAAVTFALPMLYLLLAWAGVIGG